MSKTSNSYSQNATFTLVILAAIVFACLGYWYGSTNPGGFSTMNVQSLGIGNLLSSSSKDSKGTITADIETNEQIYDNSTIGLNFHSPAGYYIKDFWPGDATDLMISASSFEYLSTINTKNEFPTFNQMQISYFDSIDQFNFAPLADVKNFDDFIAKYSANSSDVNGNIQKPYFNNPEKVKIGNLEGYKATLNKEYADGDEAGEIYLAQNGGNYFSLIFRDSKGVQELKEKVLTTINFK